MKDDFDFELTMDTAWSDALELIRQDGDDPEAIIYQAADNAQWWHDHPATYRITLQTFPTVKQWNYYWPL